MWDGAWFLFLSNEEVREQTGVADVLSSALNYSMALIWTLTSSERAVLPT